MFSSSVPDICVAPESQGGFEREQIREQLGGFIGHLSMGRLRRFLSGIIYGNPFRGGATIVRDSSFPQLSATSDTTCVVLQKARRLKSSHTPKPTWTTWSPTTMRSQRAWRTCPPPTWESIATPGSTCWNTTFQKGPAHSAAWATRGGRPSTAAWSVRVVGRNTYACTPCRVLTCGTNLSGETFIFSGMVKNTNK